MTTTFIQASAWFEDRPKFDAGWEGTSWALVFWVLTAVACVLLFLGSRAVTNMGPAAWIPTAFGLVLIIAGAHQLYRHAPDWPSVWPVFWIFAVIGVGSSFMSYVADERMGRAVGTVFLFVVVGGLLMELLQRGLTLPFIVEGFSFLLVATGFIAFVKAASRS